jgi:hypothetical protein
MEDRSILPDLNYTRQKMGISKDIMVRTLPKVGLNAATNLFGVIQVGKGLLECKDKDVRVGILAHEIGHRKARHIIKAALLLLTTMIILTIPAHLLVFPIPMLMIYVTISSILYCGIIVLVFWYNEYEADTIAAYYIGANTVISGLKAHEASLQGKKRKRDFLHPPMSKRIANLPQSTLGVRKLLGNIKANHPCLLWAIYVTLTGWLMSLVVTAGISMGFMVPLIESPTLVVIPRTLLILSCLCIVAGIVLLVRGLAVRSK